MPDFIVSALPGSVIALLLGLLGVVAYRRFNLKQLGDIQTQVNETYRTLNEAQQKEIKHLRKENIAMRAAFKHLGIEIEIDGNEVILIDEQKPRRTRIMTVSIEEEVKKADQKQTS